MTSQIKNLSIKKKWSSVFIFSVCLFVCLFVCMSRCTLSAAQRPDFLRQEADFWTQCSQGQYPEAFFSDFQNIHFYGFQSDFSCFSGTFFMHFVPFLKTKRQKFKIFLHEVVFFMPEDNRLFTFSASHVTSGILISICDCKNV